MRTSKWVNVEFESSCYKTEQFKAFARDFRSDLKTLLKQTDHEFAIVDFSVGHFYVSGFLQDIRTGRYIYFDTSDVRFFRNEWHNHMLVRTAEHPKDYTGGCNRYTSFANLPNFLDSFSK